MEMKRNACGVWHSFEGITRSIVKWILKRQDGRTWIEVIWLRAGTRGELL
jgi:hypothetical protein